ncbi:MAG: acylphosphatase [Candidatus Auribacterota bacterium]
MENHTTRSQVKVFYEGHVQGVGFRYSVLSISRQFEITGYVKNLPDGRVEVCAEGDDRELNEFLHAISVSHLRNYFTDTAKSWNAYTGRFQSFGIRQ